MFQPDRLSNLLNDKPVEVAEPFTLDSLIAWLRTKDAARTYCYMECGQCLIAQYVSEVCGYLKPNVGGFTLSDIGTVPSSKRRNIPDGFDNISGGHPRSFGAALTRALSYRSSQSGGEV